MKTKTDSTHLCACLSLSLSYSPMADDVNRTIFIHFNLNFGATKWGKTLSWISIEREKKKNCICCELCAHSYMYEVHTGARTQQGKTRQYDFMTVYSQIEYFLNYIHFCRACHSDEMRPSFFFIWFIFRFIQYIPIFHAQSWQQYLFVSFFRSIYHMKPLQGINHFLII